jgi:Cu(I)/Ag(I) efflux system membrane fusion protein
MRTIYLLFAVSLLGVASCNSNTGTAGNSTADSTKTQPKAAAPVQSKLNEQGTQMLMSVVEKYYALKNALVATKADNADAAATELATITDSFRSHIQKDNFAAALKPYLDSIITQSKIAASFKDETCEKQRIAFGPLSSAMFGLLKAADLKNAHVYQEYCPMAFNEKGAHWLSDDSDIKNPYFGKKMLECGEVTEVLK